VTLVLIIGLGTLAALGWQQFFTEFHRIFFAAGSWTFALEDTLIRLFPGQFWIDAGLVIGALVLITAVVTLILTWPTRRRRGLGPARKGRKGGKSEDEADADDAAEAVTVRPANLLPRSGNAHLAVQLLNFSVKILDDGGPLEFEGGGQVP